MKLPAISCRALCWSRGGNLHWEEARIFSEGLAWGYRFKGHCEPCLQAFKAAKQMPGIPAACSYIAYSKEVGGIGGKMAPKLELLLQFSCRVQICQVLTEIILGGLNCSPHPRCIIVFNCHQKTDANFSGLQANLDLH